MSPLRPRRQALRGIASLLLVLAALPAFATSLQVEPTRLTLGPARQTAVLALKNPGTRPLPVQVRVFAWDQNDTGEKLSASRDLRVSPPVQTIPPGARQVVRVVLPSVDDLDRERVYRVLVDELPETDGKQGEVRVLVRYSIPVFVRPEGLAPAALSARLVDDDGTLEVRNDGARTARLADVTVESAGGEPLLVKSGLLGYVLPGRVRRWQLGEPLAGGARVAARVDETTLTLPLDEAP